MSMSLVKASGEAYCLKMKAFGLSEVQIRCTLKNTVAFLSGVITRDSIYAIARISHGNSVRLSVASRLAESGPYCCSGCLAVCMSVCHSATYSLPRLIDHNQISYAGTYLSSHACKPFWIPCLPYSVPDGKIWKILPIFNFKRLPFGH